MSAAEITQTAIFYLLSAAAIGSALAVVLARRVLRSAVALALTLVCTAGFYMFLDYSFIAGVQLLVYVGGIVILIVFAVMLTSSPTLLEDHPTISRKILSAGASALFLLVTVLALINTKFPVVSDPGTPDDLTAAIGRKLLNTGADGFVLPFEIISLLLLAVVLGSIVVARSHSPDKENTSEEIS